MKIILWQGNLSFSKRLLKYNIQEKKGKTLSTLTDPIGNAKGTGEMKLHPLAPTLKHQQKYSNSCCFSRLASALTSPGKVVAAKAIEWWIEDSLIFSLRVVLIG